MVISTQSSKWIWVEQKNLSKANFIRKPYGQLHFMRECYKMVIYTGDLTIFSLGGDIL